MPLPAPLPPHTTPAPAIALDADAAERLRRLRAEATAANTARAQRSDTRYLTAWAERRLGLDLTDPAALPLPAEAVVTFVLDHVDLTGDGISLPTAVDEALVAAGVKRRPGPLGLATTERRLATLAALHRARGLPSPTLHPGVRDLLRQARRALAARGITPRAKRAATRDEVLGPMLDALPDDARGLRDRALLAVAFASGGRRRSELVALRLADVTAAGRDFTLRIRRSKTDQQGAGTDVPVKRAAADALRRWLRLLADQGISDGPLFRELSRRGRVVRRRGAEDGAKPLDGRVVAEVVKRAARAAGRLRRALAALGLPHHRRARRHPARPADAALRPQEPPHRCPLLPNRRRAPEPSRRPAVGVSSEDCAADSQNNHQEKRPPPRRTLPQAENLSRAFCF